MPRVLLFLTALLFFASCKTQKIGSAGAQAEQDTVQVVVGRMDSIPPAVTEDVVLDSVSLKIHRLLQDTIRIKAVGDIMLGTNFPDSTYLPPDRGRHMLTSITPLLKGSDLLFGNLEGVILNEGGTRKNCRNPKTCYLFRSPEYMATRLQEAGFNLLSVANNHAGDFGVEGRTNTSRVLDSLGFWYAGNNVQPYTIFKHQGMIYGFAAFAPNRGTPSINNIDSARNTVLMLDSLVDITIVSFHGGAEGAKYTGVPREHEYFYGEDRGDVYRFAHAMIDAGADVVLGHGPHVPRAVEVYKDRFIAYSLGNFATYRRFNLRGDNGLAPIVALEIGPQGKFLSGRIIPAKQIGSGIPVHDKKNVSIERMRDLTKKDFPEVDLRIDESGEIVYIHQ
jgi:hypothetical protein